MIPVLIAGLAGMPVGFVLAIAGVWLGRRIERDR